MVEGQLDIFRAICCRSKVPWLPAVITVLLVYVVRMDGFLRGVGKQGGVLDPSLFSRL